MCTKMNLINCCTCEHPLSHKAVLQSLYDLFLLKINHEQPQRWIYFPFAPLNAIFPSFKRNISRFYDAWPAFIRVVKLLFLDTSAKESLLWYLPPLSLSRPTVLAMLSHVLSRYTPFAFAEARLYSLPGRRT